MHGISVSILSNAIFTSWSGSSVFSSRDVQLSFSTDATASNGAFYFLAGTANSGRQTEFPWGQEFFLYCHCSLFLFTSDSFSPGVLQDTTGIFFPARLESGRFLAQFVTFGAADAF
jgi:hypothetical protein